VNDDPTDPNRVVPNKSAAEELWAALEANQTLELTGDVSQGDGVVVVEPETPAETPVETTAPDASATPAATPTAVELPDTIAGQTAAQETCSNGNVKKR